MAGRGYIIGVISVLLAFAIGGCRDGATSVTAAQDAAAQHRYVVMVDGIGSTGDGVSQDFTEIVARLQSFPDLRRVVLFSYGAARTEQRCAGWTACNWRGAPIYTAGDVSGTSIDEQVVVLDWLIDQIRAEDTQASIDVVGFSLGGIVLTRWAATVGLTDAGRAKGVHALVIIESPVGGSPQANACRGTITGICQILRDGFFGDAHLLELQMPTGPGQPPDSIVATLPGAASAYPVTSIESQADYLVNGVALPTQFGPAVVATGTQAWPATNLVRHADHWLGGDRLVDTPIDFAQLPDLLVSRHVPPQHHMCTVNWVDEALTGHPVPECTAPSLTTAPTANPPDWRNRTYRTDCDGAADQPFSVDLTDGSGSAASYTVNIQNIASGDLTGDGQPETAVLLRCDPEAANYYTQEIQVFAADGTPLTGPLRASALKGTTILPPQLSPSTLAIANGTVSVTADFYADGDTHASGPSRQETVVWTWTGSDLHAQIG